MDFNIKLSNGQLLKGMIMSPGENPKAVIVLIHGRGDHIQRYMHWADLFIKEGFAFTGVDLPVMAVRMDGEAILKVIGF